jgi:putative heme-binding domain-containing protein
MARTGNEAVPGLLLGKWATFSPDLRLATADLLIGRELWAFAMQQEVEAGRINPAEFDAARKQRLIYHASGRVKSLAQKLLASTANAARQSVLDDYRPALSLTGNAKNGAKLFAQNCAVCHRVGEVGNEIGPNLRSVIDWQGDALLTAIMDPSRAFEPRFQGYTATLENGDAAFGIITAETATAITIKGLDAKERTIPRSAIKSLVGTNKSLMPDGLEAQIDKQGLADLLRYVRGGGAEN